MNDRDLTFDCLQCVQATRFGSGGGSRVSRRDICRDGGELETFACGPDASVRRRFLAPSAEASVVVPPIVSIVHYMNRCYRLVMGLFSLPRYYVKKNVTRS